MCKSCHNHLSSGFLQCLYVLLICLPHGNEKRNEILYLASLSINYPVAMPLCSMILELWHKFLQAVLLFLCVHQPRHTRFSSVCPRWLQK